RREDHELAWRIGEVIHAAQHMRNAHARIIHGVAEKERGRTVRAPHDKVADIVAEETLRAVHEIHEVDARAGRHAKAQSGVEAALAATRTRRGVKLAAGAGVARRVAGGELRAPRDLKLERRAVARIEDGAPLERLEVSCVDRRALGLAVRTACI